MINQSDLHTNLFLSRTIMRGGIGGMLCNNLAAAITPAGRKDNSPPNTQESSAPVSPFFYPRGCIKTECGCFSPLPQLSYSFPMKHLKSGFHPYPETRTRKNLIYRVTRFGF